MKKLIALAVVVCLFINVSAQSDKHTVKNLKITILSTMMAQAGMGEWGFSALVEADTNKILFDAGAHQRTVIENSKELGIDLSKVPTFILSHNHPDHTIGWIPLRNEMMVTNAGALAVTHVAPGIFDTRVDGNGTEINRLKQDSALYSSLGGRVVEHENFEEIFPGIYVTGRVPRVYPEKNYPLSAKKKDNTGRVIEDVVPEDMSLVIRTEKGLVLLSGCGHSGIINTIAHTQKNLPGAVYAALGGFHLYGNADDQIKWTADQLKQAGVHYFMGAHCTGVEPVYQIREWVGLKRGECIVGAVGSSFDITKGFNAGPLVK
jgi:7,8-dihydropterin-6-yl-methyl-4-(beta-D-ribofuranosyl)aminobenzene 5'-phosphate synthase